MSSSVALRRRRCRNTAKITGRFQGGELNTKQLNEQLKLRYYADAKLSLPRGYGLETVVQSALARRVWLPSGGNIVIERTEALTVIDVNSGKDVRGKIRRQP